MVILEWFWGKAYLEVKIEGNDLGGKGSVSCISYSRVGYTEGAFVCIFTALERITVPIPLKADRRRLPWLERSWVGNLPGVFTQATFMV